MSQVALYEVKPGEWHPKRGKCSGSRSFSVSIGLRGSTRAAIYRIGGVVSQWQDVDRVAADLAQWINSGSRRGQVPPAELKPERGSGIYVRVTPAGKAQGWRA